MTANPACRNANRIAWRGFLALGLLTAAVTGCSAPVGSSPASDELPPMILSPQPDTARYVEWMAKKQKPITGTVTEQVRLRIGDWGFFAHSPAPGAPMDLAGLDRSGHFVEPKKGDWFNLLTTSELDAKGAMERASWLYRAALFLPGQAGAPPKVQAPTRSVDGDKVTATGWVGSPPGMRPQRMTITAVRDVDGAVVVFSEP